MMCQHGASHYTLLFSAGTKWTSVLAAFQERHCSEKANNSHTLIHLHPFTPIPLPNLHTLLAGLECPSPLGTTHPSTHTHPTHTHTPAHTACCTGMPQSALALRGPPLKLAPTTRSPWCSSHRFHPVKCERAEPHKVSLFSRRRELCSVGQTIIHNQQHRAREVGYWCPGAGVMQALGVLVVSVAGPP
eukprot:1139201-Pelagomonas_calceolata.AAC.8